MITPTTIHGSWITLPHAHKLLGTTSPAQDDEVQGMINSIQSMISDYLDRELRDAEYEEIFVIPEGSHIQLSNWPLIDLTAVDADGTSVPLTDFIVDSNKGILHLRSTGIGALDEGPEVLTVTYRAGYAELPPELVSMFRTLLSERYDAGGSTAADQTGDIKKVSLVGVAAVEFDTGGSSVSYSGVDRLSGVPEDLKEYIGIISRYRSNTTMGIV